jgi:hypothetical protein
MQGCFALQKICYDGGLYVWKDTEAIITNKAALDCFRRGVGNKWQSPVLQKVIVRFLKHRKTGLRSGLDLLSYFKPDKTVRRKT